MNDIINEWERVVKSNTWRDAYCYRQDKITYQELWQKAETLSRALMAEGNSPVLLWGQKEAGMVIGIIACLMANRPYVPIEESTPVERIQKIVQMTQASLTICFSNKSIENVNCLTIEKVVERYFDLPILDTSNNTIAYIIFTSGSTGNPKGVPISYENLSNFISWISQTLSMPEEIHYQVLNQASFSFDLSVADFYFSLWNGHTLWGMDREMQKSMKDVLQLIKESNIQLIVTTPTFIKMLLCNPEWEETHFPHFQMLYSCGETLEVVTAQKLRNKFPHLQIINAYGPTEATSAVSSVLVTNDMLTKNYLPVGRLSTSAVNISIEKEEIVLRGKSVFGGYLQLASEQSFQECCINGYRTGDIGLIEDDFLYCKGRIDQQVKYMGYRIELGDIENNLLKIRGVNEAVVVAKYKENTNIVKGIKAFITLSEPRETEEIKKELLQMLPLYMIPKTIQILEEIPVNDNGKYDRKKLKEW